MCRTDNYLNVSTKPHKEYLSRHKHCQNFLQFQSFFSPLEYISAACKRSRIKSISGFGVAIPCLDFFWKQ